MPPCPPQTKAEQMVSHLVWRVRFVESQLRRGQKGQWRDPHSQRLAWRNQYLAERVRQLETALAKTRSDHDLPT